MSKDKGVIKRYIVTPDKHAPLHDEKAINVVKQAIEIIKPDGYVDLGDFGEWDSISHWQWKRKSKPPLEYIIPKLDEEAEKVLEIFDNIDNSLIKAGVKDKHFCAGNHDEWLEHFVEEHPYLPQYKIHNLFDFKQKKWKYHKAGEYLKIGKLYYYHGHHFGGMYHTANHLRKLGASVIYGHFHSLQMNSATTLDGPIEAWSIGCLKDVSSENNKFLKGRPNNWVHSFAIVDYYSGGRFSIQPIKIVQGVANVFGEEIKG